ncbi:MAG: hypothetical protein E7667_06070 [Ruminococcaceae bacterium]|nr:hypothetical protein [Oscillospiraceae bacterium]
MASKINTTEYMYCSARIRAVETMLISSEKIRVMLDGATFSEAISKLEEYGADLIYFENGEVDTESTLQKMYNDACELVWNNVVHAENLNFLRYPYDCNNLKACIKCNIRNISPDSMLYDCGMFSPDEAKLAVQGEFAGYPKNMSAAISQAIDAYAKTKNPQNIDIILDRACYADMLECAENSGCEFFVELVRTKIDLTNIIMCLRLIRMKMGRMGRALLDGAVLSGGTYDLNFFAECYEDGEDRLCEALAFSKYSKFILCICENPDTLSVIEKYSDDVYMETAKYAKAVAFGPEVAAGYLIAVEYQIKNLRIILDAKRTGKTSAQTQERLRCLYV